MVNKVFILFVLSMFTIYNFFGQELNDSIFKKHNSNQFKFNYKQLIVPTILIGYGVWATDNDQLELFNLEISEELTEHIDEKVTIDDFAQYAPLVSTFAFDFAGIKSKNNIKDKAIIAATSHLIMAGIVYTIKKTAQIQRPDKTSFDSFPSGHTATAFAGAELFYQEYKDVSGWYGVSGYIVATGVGAFRIYNNRHWLSDVIAGAGIGILSTKAAYWLFPTINKLFTTKESNRKTSFVPYYDGKTIGFGLVSNF